MVGARRQRRDPVAERDVDLVDPLAVREQAGAVVEAREPALRRVLADELVALVDGDELMARDDRAGVGPVGAEIDEAGDRTACRDRGVRIVAAAEEIALVVMARRREPALVDRTA